MLDIGWTELVVIAIVLIVGAIYFARYTGGQ